MTKGYPYQNGTVPNPTGKGGFKDNPQNKANGRWDKNNSFSYWLNFFKAMNVEDFKTYEKTKTDSERTVAESLAYARISNARKELREFQEVADRTEGRAMQTMDITSKGETLFNNSKLTIEVVDSAITPEIEQETEAST